MNISKLCFCICSFLFIFQNILAARNLRAGFKSVECRSYSTEYVENATCNLVKRNEKEYINAIFTFRKPIKNFKLRWTMKLLTQNRPQILLLDLTLDGCSIIKDAQKNILTQTVWNKINKFMENPLKCPLKQNFSYTIKDLTFAENDLPVYMPNAIAQFSLYAYVSEKAVLRFMADLQVVTKAGNKDGK